MNTIMTATRPVIAIAGVTKTYTMGKIQVHALRGVSLDIHPGEYVAIVGASGSGKSTLMNIIGLLDRPTAECTLWSPRMAAASTACRRCPAAVRRNWSAAGIVYQSSDGLQMIQDAAGTGQGSTFTVTLK